MLALAFLLASPIQIEPDSGLFANAFYHAICLAEQIGCSRDKIDAFWQDDLDWGEEDGEALSAVASLLNRLDDEAPDPEPAPVPPNFAGYYPGYRARYSLLSSILNSGSAAATANVAADSLPAADAQRLAKAFAHFETRLRPWWKASGSDKATAYSLEVIAEMDGAGLGALANQLAEFLESQVGRVGLHLIVAPYEGPGALATPMGAHVFVEYSFEDSITAGAWKTLHELVHILYENGPIGRHQDLIQQFLKANQPHSMAHYVLLNEGVATASQLIAFERLGVELEDFYSDAFIPRVARSTQPLLEAALARGATLYSGFAQRYMQAADSALGDDVARPQYMLLGVGLLGMDRHPDAAEAYFELIPPIALASPDDSSEDIPDFTETNVVKLLTHDELDAERSLPLADSPNAKRRGFVYSPRPTSKKRVYLISGQSEQDLVEVVRKFADIDDATASGFLVVLD